MIFHVVATRAVDEEGLGLAADATTAQSCELGDGKKASAEPATAVSHADAIVPPCVHHHQLSAPCPELSESAATLVNTMTDGGMEALLLPVESKDTRRVSMHCQVIMCLLFIKAVGRM
jgi:hypothetical protein